MIVTTVAPNKIQKLQLTGNITLEVGAVIFQDDTVTWGEDVAEFSPKNADGYGFVYGTTSQSAPGNVAPASAGYDGYVSTSQQCGNGAYTADITALTADTLYYIRAWAHDPDGYTYGDEITIRTVGDVMDTFTFKAKDTSFTFKPKDTTFTMGRGGTMKPNKWQKQPNEMRILSIDCTDALPTAVTISSVSVAVYDEDENDVTTTIVDTSSVDGTDGVLVTVKAGTDGENYDMRVRITLSNGEVVEDDLKIKVREKGQ